MPAGHPLPALHDPPQPQHSPQQVEVCAKCQSTVPHTSFPLTIPEAVAVVCTGCGELLSSLAPDLATGTDSPDLANDINDTDAAFARLQTWDDVSPLQSTRHTPDLDDSSLISDALGLRISDEDSESCDKPAKPSASSRKPLSPCNTICIPSTAPVAPTHSNTTVHRLATTPVIESRRQTNRSTSPDPLADITRLRIRTSTHHCLYPGATFVGTQKSGRSSYDVTVTVVDVDFPASFLCGYLRIRGLTDDWPELTTYFDAEIIGGRYGFMTQKWGATEQEDLVHWARFPAFKHLKHELKKPLLTMSDRDRGAVFMRWKERFLVPDHRVQDISGASFAGFYYVCVDFGPPPTQSPTSIRSASIGPENDEADDAPRRPQSPRPNRREASRRRGRSPSMAPLSPPIAIMNGFYFHQNSEPYQQLSLTHFPERTSSSFEFR
ncbi:hypothetical protein AX17_002838 [Amanita inopinata Kibby_2008]|nr:hypothetical protein AX17_002838 [Amanita inopinata Kibby_2008]